MLPPNPLMMGPVVQTTTDGGYATETNTVPPPQQQNSADCDPDSGFSVYGKMYFEGRVVLHLKQWTETNNGGMHLPSCAQQPTPQSQPKSQFQGCALCRLKNQQDGYRGQKEAHRHSVKGVLFTFEDCIIVELYQDQTPSFGYGHLNGIFSILSKHLRLTSIMYCIIFDTCRCFLLIADPKPRPEPRKTPQAAMSIPLGSYMIPGSCGHNPNVQLVPEKRMMDPMDMVMIGADKQATDPNSAPSTAPPPPVPHQESARAWWDDFDSERETGAGGNSNDSNGDRGAKAPSPSQPPSSSASSSSSTSSLSMKQSSTGGPLPSNQDPTGGLTVLENLHQPESQSPDEYKFKWKCDDCSLSFVSQMHLEGHNCAATGSPKNAPSLEMDLDSPPRGDEEDHEDTISKDNHHMLTNGPTREESMVTPSPTCSPGIHFEESKDGKECSSISDSPSDSIGWMYSCPVTGCSKSFQLKKMLKQHQEQCQQNALNSLESTTNFSFSPEKSVDTMEQNESMESVPNDEEKEDNSNLINVSRENASFTETNEIKRRKTIRWPRKTSKFHKINNRTGFASNTHPPSRITKQIVIAKNHEERKKVLEFFDDDSGGNSDEKSDDEDEDDEEEDDYEDKKTETAGTSSMENGKRESSRRFQCNVCHKKFTLERRLERHKGAHKCDKSSQCEKCGKRFARKDKLIRHMYVHSEEKMFVCDICEKRFSRRDKLSDHLKSHGTEEVHNCPLCQKQFLRPDILKQHVKLHGMGNKHQCPECLRFVTGKDRLEKHMARHEEAKALGQTLLCPLCTKYFIQRQSLKAHIKKFHPDAIKYLEPDNEDNNSKGSGDEKSTPFNIHSAEASSIIEPSTSTPDSTCEKNNSQVCLLLEDVMGTNKTLCTKPRPFSCLVCKKDFVRKQALKKHMRKHNQPEQILGDYPESNQLKTTMAKNESSSSTLAPSELKSSDHGHTSKKKKRHKRGHVKVEPEDVTSKFSHEYSAVISNGTTGISASPPLSSGLLEMNSSEAPESTSGGPQQQIVVVTSSSPSLTSEISIPRDVGISTLASTASTTFMGVTPLAMTSHHHAALAAAAAHAQQQNACASIATPHYLQHHQHLHHGHHSLITGQEAVVSATSGHLTPTCVTQISQLSTAVPVHQHMNGNGAQTMCAPSSYVLAYPQYTYQ